MTIAKPGLTEKKTGIMIAKPGLTEKPGITIANPGFTGKLVISQVKVDEPGFTKPSLVQMQDASRMHTYSELLIVKKVF